MSAPGSNATWLACVPAPPENRAWVMSLVQGCVALAVVLGAGLVAWRLMALYFKPRWLREKEMMAKRRKPAPTAGDIAMVVTDIEGYSGEGEEQGDTLWAAAVDCERHTSACSWRTWCSPPLLLTTPPGREQVLLQPDGAPLVTPNLLLTCSPLATPHPHPSPTLRPDVQRAAAHHARAGAAQRGHPAGVPAACRPCGGAGGRLLHLRVP